MPATASLLEMQHYVVWLRTGTAFTATLLGIAFAS
jgi:hypothetical protein